MTGETHTATEPDEPSAGRPLFVCGASRSGTALVQSCLNNHPAIHLVGETHYFDDLRVRMGEAASQTLSQGQRQSCEDYFCALLHRPYGHQGDPSQSPLSADDLRARADRSGVGSDAYFEAFCRMGAEKHGARRWGDKTPRHIFRILEIGARFERAQFICMVRDPRAVVASYRGWRHQGGFDFEADPTHETAVREDVARAKASYNLLVATMLWKSTVGYALSALDAFGPERVMIVQYERLAAEPESVLRKLCAFLGEEYDPVMLEVPMHNSSFSTFEKKGGISAAPINRWRELLTPREVGVIDHVCGATLDRLGYDSSGHRATALTLGIEYIKLPWGIARAAMANRSRIPSLPRYVLGRLRGMRAASRSTPHAQVGAVDG